MRRREFIVGLGGAVVRPLAARAQRAAVRRIGVIMGVAETDNAAPERIAELKQSLRKLGWIEGQNIEIAIRWSGSQIEKARAQAKELVAQKPDALIAHTLMPALALRDLTSTIPIIFTNISDPDGARLVKSVSHPGGNVTGFSNLEPTIGAKWLQILHEIAPQITRVAVIFNPETSQVSAPFAAAAISVGPQFSLAVTQTQVHDPDELERAISSFGSGPGGGLIFPPDIFTATHRDVILPLAERYKLPAIYPYRFFIDDGGLVSYGTNPIDSFAQAASYVDRILRGAYPGDLPVQAPTKYELVINLKTAKTLGLTVSPNLLDLADDLVR